jgi:hypothetical protein
MDDLRNIDPDDISFLLLDIEKSFGFRFGKTSLEHVKTFGELCDIIADKLHERDVYDCTTQQAFYKLREALTATLGVDGSSITPDIGLLTLIPRHQTRQKVMEINKLLGVKVINLNIKTWLVNVLLAGGLVSMFAFFFNWRLALSGFCAIITAAMVTKRFFAAEMEPVTVGQLAEKFSREHYLKARRNPDTVNRREVEQKIIQLFSDKLGLDTSVLTREATWE